MLKTSPAQQAEVGKCVLGFQRQSVAAKGKPAAVLALIDPARFFR